MVRNYKDLEVYQISYNLTILLYKLTDKFPGHESNNLISQIRRASTSIPVNIAEGTGRYTKKSYLQFLGYSYGSARELQVLLSLSKDLGYFSKEDYEIVNEELDKLSRKLFVFIMKVEKERFFNWFK